MQRMKLMYIKILQESAANETDCESNPGTSGEGSHGQPAGDDNHAIGDEVSGSRREESPAKRLKPADKADLPFETLQTVMREKRDKYRDASATYGELIAHKLRQLPSDFHRTLAQRQMDDILYNMLIAIQQDEGGAASSQLSFASHSSS